MYYKAIEKKNKSEILFFIKEVNKENDEKETPLYKGILNIYILNVTLFKVNKNNLCELKNN